MLVLFLSLLYHKQFRWCIIRVFSRSARSFFVFTLPPNNDKLLKESKENHF